MTDQKPTPEPEDSTASNSTRLLSASTATSSGGETLNMDKLHEAMDLIKTLPPEPIKEWMLKNGFDPDKGDVVVWPSGDANVFEPLGPPEYVKLSRVIAVPYAIKNFTGLLDPYRR